MAKASRKFCDYIWFFKLHQSVMGVFESIIAFQENGDRHTRKTSAKGYVADIGST